MKVRTCRICGRKFTCEGGERFMQADDEEGHPSGCEQCRAPCCRGTCGVSANRIVFLDAVVKRKKGVEILPIQQPW